MLLDERDLRLAPRRAIALVLAGGRGSRLHMLTDKRAKPAVHFGGKYRIIDFALSNCLNSGIRRLFVLTQYKSHSLLRHLQRGWTFLRAETNEFVDLLPAQQRINETAWYQGTADAVFQNLDILRSQEAQWVVILAGDHIYKMDYGVLLRDHIRRNADCTVACLPVPRMEASAFGVMHVDDDDRVTAFLEKPADPPGMPYRPDLSLASMGIYVFNAEFLYRELERDAVDPASSRDFGRDIIPSLVDRARVMAHDFERSCVRSTPDAPVYWRDVGTVDAYWAANLDLTQVTPELNLYDRNWPIITYQEQLPPAKFVFDTEKRRGMAVDSLVSGGCIISGAQVRGSLLFSSVRVNSYATLDQAVVLSGCSIGRHARLRRVVIDRGTTIPDGMVVGEDPVADARRFFVSPKGVTLITQRMIEDLTTSA